MTAGPFFLCQKEEKQSRGKWHFLTAVYYSGIGGGNQG
jgi:hypothetical protein